MDENRPDEQRPMHEERDVNPWAIGKFVVALVFFCGLSLLFLIGLFRFFSSVNPASTALPPRPAKVQLEESQTENLVKLRGSEDQLLRTYGWVDQPKGVVRVPIQRAIDLLAERGLPSAPPKQQQAQVVSMPTEAGLGVQK